jgi:hypothetical protein
VSEDNPVAGVAERLEPPASAHCEGAVKVAITEHDVEGPVSIRIRYPTKFRDDKDDKRAGLQDIVATKLPRHRYRATWDHERGVVDFVRRPKMPTRIGHPGLAPSRPWNILPFAIDENGNTAAIDLLVIPHWLITGATRRGKTSTVRSVIIAAAEHMDVRLVDPKRIEFAAFRGWPGVNAIATEGQQFIDVPDDVHREMNRRYAREDREGIPAMSHRPILLVIDEYKRWTEIVDGLSGAGGSRGRKSGPAVINNVQEIAATGAGANVYLIVLTQRADATWFDGGFRENLLGRIAVGQMTAEAARMAFGDSSIGRDIDAETKGRTSVRLGTARVFEVQSWWTPSPGHPDNTAADNDIVDRLRPQRAAAPPTVEPELAEPEPEPEPAERTATVLRFPGASTAPGTSPTARTPAIIDGELADPPDVPDARDDDPADPVDPAPEPADPEPQPEQEAPPVSTTAPNSLTHVRARDLKPFMRIIVGDNRLFSVDAVVIPDGDDTKREITYHERKQPRRTVVVPADECFPRGM